MQKSVAIDEYQRVVRKKRLVFPTLLLNDINDSNILCTNVFKRHFFTTTGLVISERDDNLDEYWEGDELKYLCKDGELGTDASAYNFKTYKCKRYAF